MSATVRTGTPPETPVAETQGSVALAAAGETPRSPVVSSEFGATSMQQLLHFAIEKGTPVEQLERLVDLAERMQNREARLAFNAALARFQAKVRPIFRAKTANIATKGGGTFSYKYAELDDIVEVISGPLTEEGLSYKWNSRIEKNLVVDTVISHIDGHSETTSFTLPIDSSAAMSEQQKYGAAFTFGQRRGLSAALGLVTTSEDPDSPKLDPTPVTEDQVIAIEDLLRETGTSRQRFLKFMEVDEVPKIRAAEYKRAIAVLEEIREKKEQKSRSPR